MLKGDGKFLNKTPEEIEELWKKDTSERVSYKEYKEKFSECHCSDYDGTTKTIFVHKNAAIDYVLDKENYTSDVYLGTSLFDLLPRMKTYEGEGAK